MKLVDPGFCTKVFKIYPDMQRRYLFGDGRRQFAGKGLDYDIVGRRIIAGVLHPLTHIDIEYALLC